MRRIPAVVALACLVALPSAAEKLNFDQRVEIVRGLMAEYATMKVLLPRSKKPLPVSAGTGAREKDKWEEAARELGPAARVGDLVQITRVLIDDKEIVFEINGGMKSKTKWYERIEVGMGNRTTPVAQGQNRQAAVGSYVGLQFPDGVPPVTSAELKKMLTPVMDFEKRSATEQFVQQLPPEIQTAIKDKKAIDGMDREQVVLAMGKPRLKSRETKEGLDLEDWIYGQAPGRITFVTFQGGKVVKVKENYAGLGGATAERTIAP